MAINKQAVAKNILIALGLVSVLSVLVIAPGLAEFFLLFPR